MRRWALAIFVAVVAGTGVWWLVSRQPGSEAQVHAKPTNEPETEPTSNPGSASAVIPADTRVPDVPRIATGPVEAASPHGRLAPRPAAPENVSGPDVGVGLTPNVVMENMRTAFRQYGSRFGGNPFGNNAEITASLNGGNPKQIVFVSPEDGLRINEQGELVDNWNTPFFFHQISRTVMEIRSAGPDRKMWTRDDILLK